MPGTTAYFPTMGKTFDTDGAQTGGFWSISHASIFDPFHISGRNQMRNYGMRTYPELRDYMKMMFLDISRDPGIIQRIKNAVIKYIPVRTAKLLDTIFKTMWLNRSSWYSTHYFIDLLYEWPEDRPKYINNPQHRPPEKGYGDWAGYIPTTPEAISRVSIDHVTMGGNALYNLDDPQASSDPMVDIEREAQLILEDDFAEAFNNIIITYTMKGL